MRVSKGALLVGIVLLVPFVIELRTVLSWFGVEITVTESILVGLALALAITAWALWPPNGDAEAADRS
ncbi:CbaC protein [Natronococcus sp. JC468]|uniref:CbaC protein n=1 Tax=Natronococcus sp. JC468 TaxID=1961921 RepID=UPI0014391F91|nr:CbaC protein [Natronococcus sp. JC468]NKE37855.1 CbaC protein [Natronococcus sp. JC468]